MKNEKNYEHPDRAERRAMERARKKRTDSPAKRRKGKRKRPKAHLKWKNVKLAAELRAKTKELVTSGEVVYANADAIRSRDWAVFSTAIVPQPFHATLMQGYYALLRDNGFTLAPGTPATEPTVGWAVSLPGQVVITGDLSAKKIMAQLKKHLVRVWQDLVFPGPPQLCWGAWYDRKGKRILLDVSIVLPDVELALMTAQSFNQEAIYHLDTQTVHEVPNGS